MDARPIDPGSANGAEASAEHRRIRADCRGDGSRPSSGLDCPADAPARPARWRRRGRRGHRARLRQPARRPRRAVLLRARLHPRRPRLRARRRRRGARRRSSSTTRSGSACPRSSSTTCAPRWPPPPPASTAIRPPRCGRRGHRHERQDDDRVPRARAARGRGPPTRAARHRQVGRRRARSARSCARRRRRSTSRPTFAAMRAGGDTPCVMEVSWHALDAAARRRDPLGRRDLHEPHAGPPRLPPDDGGLLRGQAPALRGRSGGAVVNVDDPYGRPPGGRVRRHGDLRDRRRRRPPRRDVRAGRDGSEFVVRSPDGDFPTALPLPGRFNVSNVLAALRGGARARRPRRDVLARRCRTSRAVPGRFEPVDEGQAFAVLVDYAHTPDSLENVLAAARDLAARPRDRASSAAAATATAASAR